jgi:hypothetical protein
MAGGRYGSNDGLRLKKIIRWLAENIGQLTHGFAANFVQQPIWYENVLAGVLSNMLGLVTDLGRSAYPAAKKSSSVRHEPGGYEGR